MDFGIYLRDAQTYPQMLERARKAEDLGFTHAFLNDHVHGFAQEGKEPYLEAWTAMTGIGLETDLRVGHVVLFNSLRNPALLAKMVSTLDVMIQGRYELLIGAGWNEPECVGYDPLGSGKGMPSAGERVDRFKESLLILKKMLHNDVTDFDGDYFKLRGAINLPQPVQNPFRISVGGTQSRMRRIAAKYADGINLTGTLDQLEYLHKHMLAELDHVDKSSNDFYFSGFGGVRLAATEEQTVQMAEQAAKRQNISTEEARKKMLIGTSDELAVKFGKLKDDLDFKLMIVVVTGVPSIADPMSTFSDEVMKRL